MESATYGKKVHKGTAPAIALVNPKYPHNVAKVVRLASCYGFRQVWFSGNRVSLEPKAKGKKRLPREERMKGYKSVELRQHDYFFEQFEKITPVAIEVRDNSENLLDFIHPPNPVYVFGPEDGSIPVGMLRECHRFVVIPTRHCLNLSTAVATVLWDREVKRYLNGEIGDIITPGIHEQRGVEEADLIPSLVY